MVPGNHVHSRALVYAHYTLYIQPWFIQPVQCVGTLCCLCLDYTATTLRLYYQWLDHSATILPLHCHYTTSGWTTQGWQVGARNCWQCTQLYTNVPKCTQVYENVHKHINMYPTKLYCTQLHYSVLTCSALHA